MPLARRPVAAEEIVEWKQARGKSVRNLGIYKGIQDDWNKKVEGELRGEDTGGAVLPCWSEKEFVLYLGSKIEKGMLNMKKISLDLYSGKELLAIKKKMSWQKKKKNLRDELKQ